MLCIDRKSGKILWQKPPGLLHPTKAITAATPAASASNSPATDGKYVYAFFGSRGLFCYDFNGKLIWQKDPGIQMKIKLAFGEGAAPLLLGDRLIVTFDHEAGSFIIALDKKNGKELWRVSREEGTSWSTPLAIDFGGRKQVVVTASNKVRSYDPENGKLLWEAAGLGTNVIPAPVYQNGVVYVMSGHREPKLMAIKLGKEGDLTNTDAVLWSHTRGLAYTTSPVLYDNKLYYVTDNGLLSALNATRATLLRSNALPKTYNSKHHQSASTESCTRLRMATS